MSRQDDIRLVIEQEKALVFAEFDEAVAFRIGSALRDTALAGGLGIVADVRTWERPLFYMAMPGTTGDNPHWVRRKANLVQRVAKSSYRVVLEKTWEGDTFPPRRAFDDREQACGCSSADHLGCEACRWTPGDVCARARLRRRLESGQGRRQDRQPEVAAVLERLQQAQESGRHVSAASPRETRLRDTGLIARV